MMTIEKLEKVIIAFKEAHLRYPTSIRISKKKYKEICRELSVENEGVEKLFGIPITVEKNVVYKSIKTKKLEVSKTGFFLEIKKDDST